MLLVPVQTVVAPEILPETLVGFTVIAIGKADDWQDPLVTTAL